MSPSLDADPTFATDYEEWLDEDHYPEIDEEEIEEEWLRDMEDYDNYMKQFDE